jgi:hypothetical protein
MHEIASQLLVEHVLQFSMLRSVVGVEPEVSRAGSANLSVYDDISYIADERRKSLAIESGHDN